MKPESSPASVGPWSASNSVSRTELMLALSLLCLLVLLPFWRVVIGQGLVITNDRAVSDIANQYHPMRHFAAQELRQGRLPLWVPGIYMGFPLLGEGQTGLFYPPNLLLFRLLSGLWAFNLSTLLPFVVAAGGAYLLARELGAGVAGALLAGSGYALSGFFVVHVKHMPMVEAASWIPTLLWLVERGARHSDGALLGVGGVMGIQWLVGAPQIVYYTAGVAALYFAGRLWTWRERRSLPRAILLFGLALTLSLGLGAVQLLPTYELMDFSERAGGVSYQFAASFPYALENLKTFFYPLANGDPSLRNYTVSSIFWEDYAYFGLLPLLLGLIGGGVLARRSGLARLLLGLAALTFLLAWGPNTPLYRWAYRWVPGWGFFRFPQRLFAFAVLFLILLAALALTRFQDWLDHRRGGGGRVRGWGVGGLALLLVVADLYTYHFSWNAIVDADRWLTPPPTAQAIQERAGSTLYRVFTYNPYNTFRAAYRQAEGWRGDLSPYLTQRDFLQPSLNLIYDVPAAEGYINLVPECLVTLWGNEKQRGLMDTSLAKIQGEDHLEVRPGFIELFSLYNVRFLIAAQPVRDDALTLVGQYDSGVHLYENLRVLPRAFVVPNYVVVDELPAALALMRSPAFDPAETVVLWEHPPAAAPPMGMGENVGEGFSATVDVVSYAPNRVVIEAALERPGWLVLSDTYYAGWEATVDDAPVRIYRANGCVRALPLAEGQHEVVFRFRPRSFYRGALISGLSGLLLTGAWLLLRVKSSEEER